MESGGIACAGAYAPFYIYSTMEEREVVCMWGGESCVGPEFDGIEGRFAFCDIEEVNVDVRADARY
jgi:hypothetical protein